MICTQPPLDVCKIMKNHCCRCLCCGLSGGGERAGRMHHWRLLGWTAMTIVMATVWAKKGLDKGRGEGDLKMGLFFHAVLFFYCFLVFLFQCRPIDFISRSSQLLDGLLLHNFFFSYSNLVVELLFIKFKSAHMDTSKKYLWRIANFMTTHNNKRKRNRIDEEDNDCSNDDK